MAHSTTAPAADCFSIFELPVHPDIDLTELEKRFLTRCRVVHPDMHALSDATAQAAMLARFAELNRAYRVLRDPVQRGRHLLEVLEEPLIDASKAVPPELATLVFDVQESLELWRGHSRSDRILGELEAAQLQIRTWELRLRESLQQLYASWPENLSKDGKGMLRQAQHERIDSDRKSIFAHPEPVEGGATRARRAAHIAELKRVLSELAYLTTLQRDVEYAIDPTSR